MPGSAVISSIATSTGGSKGGGARVTPLGQQVRAEYGGLVARIEAAAGAAPMLALLRHEPLPPAHQ